jgi:hypothetical protein
VVPSDARFALSVLNPRGGVQGVRADFLAGGSAQAEAVPPRHRVGEAGRRVRHPERAPRVSPRAVGTAVAIPYGQHRAIPTGREGCAGGTDEADGMRRTTARQNWGVGHKPRAVACRPPSGC